MHHLNSNVWRRLFVTTNQSFDWTDEQKAIFEPVRWGHTIISACAGSGKSTTIIERCIRHTKRIKPWQSIALISFTNKSAQDLREKLLNKGANSQIITSTFHAFLKQHVLGFDESFRGKKLPFTYSDKQSNLFDWLNYFESNEKIPFATGKNDDFLLEHSLALLRTKPQLQKYLQAKFHAIYIDEAQDNNHWQYDIVDELIQLGIECILIGDPNQTIFTFRGANPQKFNDLSNDDRFTQSGGVLSLSLNHRCHERINHWANQTSLPKQKDVDETSKHGVFCFASTYLENKSHSSKILQNEGFAVLVRKNDQLDSLPEHIKIIKPLDLVEQSGNPERVANLYRLALLGNQFNEYHFCNAESSDESVTPTALKSLREFNRSPNSTTLRDLNEKLSVLDVAQEKRFIESLSDKKVTGFFTYNPLRDQVAMTIHSAKGLEFNNVFVYASDFFNLRNEGDKRLHYVAFTRAKNRLIVLK